MNENNPGDVVHKQDEKTYKSDYKLSGEEAKAKLDKVSPTMCLAKWNQVSFHLQTGFTNSCYHPPLHKIPTDKLEQDPSTLHNTPQKKRERSDMIAGNRPPECSYCWKMEDLGEMSDRHYRSGEPWAMIDYDQIVADPQANHVPRYVEVNFNNACNFKCSYCSPQFSTTWHKEINQHGGYPTSPEHNAPEHFKGERNPVPHREKNPYVEAFWRWWPDLYPKLKHFRMTGGEPMMDFNTFRVFNWVVDNPKPDLHLNVTSNFCPATEIIWQKYIDYVKRITEDHCVEHFMQFVSLDGWGERAEYIRNGMDFGTVWSNVEYFLDYVDKRSSITFIITYTNLSVTSIKELLENILDLRKRFSKTYQRVWFDTPVLRQPAWQNINLLPEAYQHIHQEAIDFMKANMETPETRFHGFKDYEVQKMERDLKYMASKPNHEYVNRQKANFYRFFNEHDRRRGTDFLKTFPEMEEWWKECKTLTYDV
jgi:hypothetical protein